MTKPTRFLLSASAILLSAAPAFAQTADVTTEPSVFDGDYVVVGIGGGIAPSYEGSDDYTVFPAPLIRGSVGGYKFTARGPGLFVDVVREAPDARLDIIFGPIARARFDRNNRIKDDVVARLGKRDVAVEVGGSAGIAVNRLLNPYDSLTFQTDVMFDVAGAHSGSVISPSLAYTTPLSRSSFVLLSVGGDWVDDSYADYYYTINAADSTASGLPVFQADGGLKSIGVSLLGGIDLSGNGLDGGWGVYAFGNYSRLQNAAAASPVTSVRGDANQWFGAVGVSYTF